MSVINLDDRESGVAAVIFLQAHVGIKETRERAEKGWDRMREWEKRTTLEWYQRLKPAETQS